jgi:hypothetical protein
MVTDYWPDKEGYIFEGCMVLPCYAASAIAEMACVYLSATAAGRITVENSAAAGDSHGVALRAATNAADIIPVAFNGVVKMIAGCTIALGDSVIGSGTDSAIIYDCATFDGVAHTSVHLGIALQAGATTGDEILVLLGGMR